MIPACVTTFGPTYYDRYGREAVATMAEFWPGPVIAYGEGPCPPDLPQRVVYRDLMAQSDFVVFLDWTGKVPLLRGVLPDGSYNYHFNLHKFGRKVFVVTAMEEPFFFVGADVHILKPIPVEFLTRMLEGQFGAFLFRKTIHTESDFAGYNTAHPMWPTFAKSWRSMYVNGAILGLPALDPDTHGFHDCWSLDYLLRAMNLVWQCTNITGDVRGDDEKGFHVWPKTVLAEYMVHLKGRLKKDPIRKAQALRGAA